MKKFSFLNFLAAIAVGCLGCGGGGDSGSGNACNTVNRISGGDSCSSGQANVAFILTSNGAECTGSYISLTSVLTAGHCFLSRPNQVVVASLGNVRQAVRIDFHPLYNGSVSSPFDMAIVKVDQPLNGSPLPLLLSRAPEAGETAVAFGYGVDQTGQDALERVNSGAAPLKATFTTFAGYYSGTAAIVSTGEGSTCPGDSGGPVLAQNSAGSYGIIGITRAGQQGCEATAGTPSYLSSTQSNGAIDFLSRYVPDAANN